MGIRDGQGGGNIARSVSGDSTQGGGNIARSVSGDSTAGISTMEVEPVSMSEPVADASVVVDTDAPIPIVSADMEVEADPVVKEQSSVPEAMSTSTSLPTPEECARAMDSLGSSVPSESVPSAAKADPGDVGGLASSSSGPAVYSSETPAPKKVKAPSDCRVVGGGR